MNENNLRLDGNAAGGLLNEVFGFEMTTANTTCAGCGATKAVAQLMVYMHPMGAVMRCPCCDDPLMRVTRVGGYYRLDLSGMSCLQIAADLQ